MRGRLERIPRDGLSPWLIAAALGLASAAAAGLKAPNWVWIVALVAAGLFAIAGIVLLFVHVPAAPASLSRNPSDLALRIASELEDANNHIGIALMRGELWLPAHGPRRSVWDAREAALLAFGDQFYQPARDAYRKIGQHQLDAESAEAAEYAAVGGDLVAEGRLLTAKARTELEETRSVIAHALDRLAELEGPRRLVTDDHREALRAMLDAARASVESHTARPRGEPLDHEVFEAHYRELDAWLTDWDDVVQRNSSAPLALRCAIAARLSARQLDHAPYIPDAIVEGFASITERRSLEGRLIEPLFPAIGDRSVFRGFASAEQRAGMVDFNPMGYYPVRGNVLVMERDAYPTRRFSEVVVDLLRPLHEVLTEAQDWDVADEIRLAREALHGFPVDALVEDIKRARLRPSIAVVPGCPGCDT